MASWLSRPGDLVTNFRKPVSFRVSDSRETVGNHFSVRTVNFDHGNFFFKIGLEFYNKYISSKQTSRFLNTFIAAIYGN